MLYSKDVQKPYANKFRDIECVRRFSWFFVCDDGKLHYKKYTIHQCVVVDVVTHTYIQHIKIQPPLAIFLYILYCYFSFNCIYISATKTASYRATSSSSSTSRFKKIHNRKKFISANNFFHLQYARENIWKSFASLFQPLRKKLQKSMKVHI